MTKTEPAEKKIGGKAEVEQKMAMLKTKRIKIKKRKPQKVMEQFFSVTREKGKKVTSNFQGFPLSECKFAVNLGKHVY